MAPPPIEESLDGPMAPDVPSRGGAELGGLGAAEEGEQAGREADVLPFSSDDIKTLIDIVDTLAETHNAVTALNVSEEERNRTILQVTV